MHTGSGRCSIFAMRTTSDYLPRLASAARRVQGPRSGTFRKLDTELLIVESTYLTAPRGLHSHEPIGNSGPNHLAPPGMAARA